LKRKEKYSPGVVPKYGTTPGEKRK